MPIQDDRDDASSHLAYFFSNIMHVPCRKGGNGDPACDRKSSWRTIRIREPNALGALRMGRRDDDRREHDGTSLEEGKEDARTCCSFPEIFPFHTRK